MKIIVGFFWLLFSLFFVLSSSVCYGASSTVSVSANVTSQVSKQLSSISSSSVSTLADPAGHSILISATLVDENKQPLANKLVQFSSSRGSLDIIEATSKLVNLRPGSAAEQSSSEMQKDYTDDNGLVTFRLTSFVTGQTEIKIIADNIVELNSVKASFDPLPLSMGITVVTKISALNQELTLLSSDYNKDALTDLQKQALSNATPGVKIYIPIWIFILLCLGFLILLALVIIVAFNRVLIGNINEKELDILGKMYGSKSTESSRKDIAKSEQRN